MSSTQHEPPESFNGCDARLTGIDWIGDSDVHLTFLLADGRVARLECGAARHVRIDLRFDELVGSGLAWDVSVDRRTSGWQILADFAGAPPGAVELDCADLVVRYDIAREHPTTA